MRIVKKMLSVVKQKSATQPHAPKARSAISGRPTELDVLVRGKKP